METLETPDGNLLQEKHQQDLLKSYVNLKTKSNYVSCKVANDYMCQIVNTSEVSRAFENYMKKMSSVAPKNEKLLEICQEIEKLHHTIETEKNDGISVSIRMNESDFCFERNILPNQDITTSFSEENFVELSSNCLTETTNNNLTSNDFLTTNEENSSLINEKEEIVKMRDDEKLQAHEMVQNHPPVLQHSLTELPPSSKSSSEKEVKKMNNSVVKGNQNICDIQSSTERPYVCSKCQKAFKRNLHLKRHFLVTHTPSKNFKCDTCGKLFSRKDYLDKHLTGHQKKYLKMKLLEQGIVVRTKIFSKSNK